MPGPYRNEFMGAMKAEIEELEKHVTWKVIKHSDMKKTKKNDGTYGYLQVLTGTWVYRMMRFPSDEMRQIKARFCAREDLQNDEDVFEKFSAVASWPSIRILLTTAIQRDWKIEQIDFSNAFIQADMERDVFVSIPVMFSDFNGIPSSEICLKLMKSLYGLKEVLRLWHDCLAKVLIKEELTPSSHDPAIFYGRNMALAVYVDDVLIFGPSATKIHKVIKELKLDFDLEV